MSAQGEVGDVQHTTSDVDSILCAHVVREETSTDEVELIWNIS